MVKKRRVVAAGKVRAGVVAERASNRAHWLAASFAGNEKQQGSCWLWTSRRVCMLLGLITEQSKQLLTTTTTKTTTKNPTKPKFFIPWRKIKSRAFTVFLPSSCSFLLQSSNAHRAQQDFMWKSLGLSPNFFSDNSVERLYRTEWFGDLGSLS